MGSTKIKIVIRSLEDFIENYFGPPFLLTTDRGPQFGGANKAIKAWAEEARINHKVASAYSPQSNGEAEQAVKRVKAAIAHCDGTPAGITSVCHNLNWEQRPNKSGSLVELFMNWGPRFPGLPTIPHKILDNSDERERREGSRIKQNQRAHKSSSQVTHYLQDSEGK